MLRDYGFDIDEKALNDLIHAEKWDEAFDLLAAPLHEWLYGVQDFGALSGRTAAEQLILTFDYVQMQVGQGGFIQLIQNGYVSLLLTVIEALQTVELCREMISVLDDALKIYILNRETLDRETSVREFGRLYEDFREFQELEDRFAFLRPRTVEELVRYTAG